MSEQETGQPEKTAAKPKSKGAGKTIRIHTESERIHPKRAIGRFANLREVPATARRLW